jgi:hypothetical protein
MAPHEQPCLLPRAVYLSALAPRGQAGTHAPPFAAAAAMEVTGGSGVTNLLLGPLLQCMEAATLGMPLEARARAQQGTPGGAAAVAAAPPFPRRRRRAAGALLLCIAGGAAPGGGD